jgi:CheY-like chemotaxis protein
MREIYLQGLGSGGKAGDPLDTGLAITHFPCVVGRNKDCDQVVDLPFISRRHCCFFVRDGRVWVQDLGSRNGTRLNGVVAEGAQPVQDGDQLALGHLALKVRLPAQLDAPAVLNDPAATVLQMELAHRVLVVDDNEDAAESLAMLLKTWGHEVRVAHDGPNALETAKQYRPDAVLLDLRLPGMDGYHVARRLREDGLLDARIVAVTGYDDETDRRRYREAGFNLFLTKPVDPNALRELLNQ